jgi:hypothetical protein
MSEPRSSSRKPCCVDLQSFSFFLASKAAQRLFPTRLGGAPHGICLGKLHKRPFELFHPRLSRAALPKTLILCVGSLPGCDSNSRTVPHESAYGTRVSSPSVQKGELFHRTLAAALGAWARRMTRWGKGEMERRAGLWLSIEERTKFAILT